MSGSIVERIVKTPGICGGRACIAGHRVCVLDIAAWHELQGMTADEIVVHVPSITLADVHAALSYYFDHVAEIQEEMQAERVFGDEIRRGNRSVLEAKLRHGQMEEAS